MQRRLRRSGTTAEAVKSSVRRSKARGNRRWRRFDVYQLVSLQLATIVNVLCQDGRGHRTDVSTDALAVQKDSKDSSTPHILRDKHRFHKMAMARLREYVPVDICCSTSVHAECSTQRQRYILGTVHACLQPATSCTCHTQYTIHACIALSLVAVQRGHVYHSAASTPYCRALLHRTRPLRARQVPLACQGTGATSQHMVPMLHAAAQTAPVLALVACMCLCG